ncbi:MAG: hypothetical protein ACI4VK_06365 [Candidatus Coproplasma sp.]
MKKTHKIIMGITALVVAFSACAFTACNSDNEPTDGSIKGNYQEATAEEVNTTLSSVDQEKLFGDTSAEDYKFGIDLSSELKASLTSATKNQSIQLSAGYQLLATAGESALSFKGAGNLTMNGTETVEGETTTNETTLNLWQDGAMTYAKMLSKSSEDEEGKETQPYKIKFDVSELASSLLPSLGDGSDTTQLPVDEGNLESITISDISSLNLVSAVNKLNEMGATVAMDITNGIKLKISCSEELVLNALASAVNMNVEKLSSQITFDKCGLDFYLAIDRNGMLSATSIVADIEISQPQTDETTEVTPSIKVNGFIRFSVNSNVNPEIPESLKTDSYIDLTTILPALIGGYIGNIGITG